MAKLSLRNKMWFKNCPPSAQAPGLSADQPFVQLLLHLVPAPGEPFPHVPLLKAWVVQVGQRLANDFTELRDQPPFPIPAEEARDRPGIHRPFAQEADQDDASHNGCEHNLHA